MHQKRVAVVGAGISGLTCARELSRSGFQVTTLEQEATVGGRMNTRVKDGFSFDFGADFLADCYSNFNQLAKDVGVEIRSVGEVHHVCVRRGELHNLNFSSIADVVRFRGISVLSRIRLLLFSAYVLVRYPDLDFFDLSKVPDSLKKGNAYDLCARVVGKDFADYIVDPFSTCMMFYRAREVSAGAFLSLFSMMINQRHSFGVRRAMGAMRAVPAALAAQLTVQTNATVDMVVHQGDQIAVRCNGETSLYDAVVMAAPAGVTLRILKDPTPDQLALLTGTSYSQTIEVSFRLPKDTLSGVHCYYVPYVENTTISEFTNEAVKGAETVHDGWSLVNVGLHDQAARRLIDAPEEEIYSVVKAELIKVSPQIARIADFLTPHDLQRWRQAIPRYTTEHLDRVQEFWSRGQGERNVYFCGDYLSHPWIEGSIRCGKKVAKQVTRSLAPVPTAAQERSHGKPTRGSMVTAPAMVVVDPGDRS